ncbi:glycosyltransferase involved in cell wall biosynthesis [Caldalkalibacillus uzonensis]|uniref:Glycosyltransferase involved in cell wall biosynthesis n=1 Tax=Caldalkalibacillus uzonensis TaxID=353224 RepID=A0ABU0CRG4_9BACI|nr:glycosyltransferase [Caldalkalibacillus uzonensis]MDQ0339008.1 glycosyltransferase involved in cell wall biosynthesis [Caldalkalibacillus uzonensis]
MTSQLATKVTAIIKTFERPHCLNRLVDSIKKYYPDLPIIVADDSLKPVPRSDVEYHILPFDSGLPKGRNFLIQQVKTPYVLVLDDDYCFIEETKIEKLLDVLENSDIDIVGGRLLEKNHVRSFHGKLIRRGTKLRKVRKSNGKQYGCRLYDYINNFFLARTETLRKYKWDEQFKTGGQHIDFFLSYKGKIKVALHPEVFIYHFRDRTDDRYKKYRKRAKEIYKPLFLKKHGLSEYKTARGLLPLKTVQKHLSSETIERFSLKL